MEYEIAISALQHFIFCHRQCALIHTEQAWEENQFTAEGRLMHEKADENTLEKQGEIYIGRGLFINNTELGIYGRADIVEFHPDPGGVKIPAISRGIYMPFPVEYKRGKPKKNLSDKVQLIAQAVCLEWMLGVSIPAGALFYGKNRRRLEVSFDEALRQSLLSTIDDTRALLSSGIIPSPVNDSRCDLCSLQSICMPRNRKSIKSYIERMT